MSETIGSMEKLDMRKSEDDRLYWVDTENGGTIPEEEALKFLGVDPEERQEPAEAIWCRQDTGEELEVKITGIFARNNEKKEDYLQAEGLTVGIPRSELTFKEQEISENSEIADLKEMIKKLTAQVEKLERKNSELEAKLEGKKPPVPETEPEEYEGYKKKDEVGLKSDEKYMVGYTVEGFTEPDEEGRRKVRIKKEGQPERTVELSELKKREEISDEETLTEAPSAAPAAVKVDYKEPLHMRLRRVLTGEAEPPQYYKDDKGYFYYEDGEKIYVPSEKFEKEGNGARGALLVLGAAALAAFIGYEIGKSGHSSNIDVTKIRKEVDDLNQQLNVFEAQNTAQHIHDHQHELRAIHGLHNQIARDHTQEMKAINSLKGQISSGAGLHERAQDTGIYWGMRYPWDWAANKVGAFKAEGWLHTLAAKAAEHGHKVRWLTGGHGTEILQVDGRTDTGYVVNTLKQY